jgi:hypothetical protein
MVAPRSPRKILIKVGGALAAVAVLAFLVMWTARSSRSEAYNLPADAIAPWTLSVEPPSTPNEAALTLRPPRALTTALFDQTFKRSMESMRASDTPGIPLVLFGELERAGAGRPTPDELVKMARDAGLEQSPPAARCFGHRRMPEPDARQQVYFALFESPAFTAFRQALARRLGVPFDAAFVSPVHLIGMVESSTERWLPLHADPEKDCVAPIVTQK